MSSFETLRRRIQALDREIRQGYAPWMHDKGYYLPVDDPRNKWKDESGFLHICVPAKLTDTGRRLGLPCQELVIDIPRARSPNEHREQEENQIETD